MRSHDDVLPTNFLHRSSRRHNDTDLWLARDVSIHAYNWNVYVNTALGINSCSGAMFGDCIKACGWFDAILCRHAQHFGNSDGVLAVLGKA